MRMLLALGVVAVLVLGYGYYHAATHGWLHVALTDSAVKPYSASIRNAEIRLLDENGKLLANAKSDDLYGVVRLIHPVAGDCSAEEQNAQASETARQQWQTCFQTISTWLIEWAAKVRSADVKFASCDLKAIPAAPHESSGDWWLWWVPLPHIGGKPLTYFTLSINVDSRICNPVSR